jgi:MscS family membrane protein
VTAGTTVLRLCAKALAFVALMALLTGIASAADRYPLRPPDTSSPRATLQGFIEAADELYVRMADVMEDYARSDRLYLTQEESRTHVDTLRNAAKLARFIDVSGIPPVLRETLTVERLLQLKEILDRVEIPAFADIPDRDQMVRQSVKRWRLPNTEIDIVLIETGPRTGEYLVSAETVDRLPEFYEHVKDLPYKPGPAERLYAVYRTISSNGAATIFDAFLSSPLGLSRIVPPRWMLGLPGWARVHVLGAATWQWLGLLVGVLIAALIIMGGRRVARSRTDDGEDPGMGWRSLPVPLAVILVAGGLVPLLATLLRIGAETRVVLDYAATAVLFLSTAWLAVVVAVVIGETIVLSERLATRSLDSQLIRLGARLVGVVAATIILIQGADELGFPAYSVLAGLGVGGLAVALAARDTIANLIGSLLIALEKPFRVGHVVRIGGSEGTVEDVGFRSTRIRTPDNSLVSIPSSAVVNTIVENLSLRTKRRQRFLVQVTYDTSRARLTELIERIRHLIVEHPSAEASTCQVRFNNLGESSLDILVIFHLLVDDYATELCERESVLLQIMAIVEDLGVELAFPTRTLHLESTAAKATARPSEASLIGFVGRS